MSNLRLLPFLLGSLALLTSANKNLEQIPESLCITYLLTYLVPISVAPSSPGESPLPGSRDLCRVENIFHFGPLPFSTFLLPTADTTSAPASATTDASVDEELIVLRIVTDLLVGGNPVYYNGEEFKVLSSPGRTPSGAITRTFTRDGNKLRFQSSRFPTGEAGFCQTPSDGQVYITFSSEPAGCIPVTILVVSSEQCQDGTVVVSTTAASESQQFISTSFLESVISTSSSFGQGPPTVSTRPDDIITTRSVIPAPIPSSSFMWSNVSSSSQTPPKTQRSSSFIPLSTFPSTSGSSTLAGVVVSTSSSVEATEVSTAESTESTNKSSTQIDELTSTTKDATTSTFQTTTLANSQTTTESAAGETTVDTTTEGSTTDIPTTTAEESTTDIPTSIDVESTTNIPTTSADESTSEIPITTTLSSALDSTTETTTEAATTTTAEAVPQVICPSNPQQCFNTMLIYCETVVGGIPLSPGTFSAQECFEKCYLDAACVIWTHSGTQCFLTNNLSDNQGQFGIQGWTSELPI
ncbi:hypothetical protein BKA59DRAFT_498742 [Fusarium tricinctum]|uniref:DUF7908 domain-containing protein n=1 Tax=Fusarium tricinctum TaxID=61284 RepID=A0A8K0SC92_9HYPO|nr:hypothetical protein BKA59DRAFT_498742 [Fusarium tricinctum]